MTWATLLTALQRHLFPSLRKLLEEQRRDWFVGYEQKMKLDPHDQRIGVLPDLYVLPCQPQDPNFSEWPAYDPGVPAPVFALEVVSPSNWAKDYVESPQKYAKLGVEELLLFDELALEGKSPASEPYALQLYRKDRRGALKRVYAGEGPVYSETLGIWFRTVENQLTVTRDQGGKSRIFTYEETERWWAKLEEALAKVEKERFARAEVEKAWKAALDQVEQERRAKEQAKAKAKQERLAKEKAEQARQEAQNKAEQESLAKEEAERQAQQERLAKEKAEQARQEAQNKAEQERLAKEEAERQAQQERLAKEEAERQAQQERLAKEKAEQARQAAEQAKQAAEQAKREAEQELLREARLAVMDLCESLNLPWDEERRRRVDSLDLPALRQLRATLKQHKRWPALPRPRSRPEGERSG